MKLGGRRRSGNMVDRRRSSGTTLGVSGGIVGIIIVGLITLFSGGDISDIIEAVADRTTSGQFMSGNYEPDAEDDRLADLASKVLAGTEDVWTEQFRKHGWGEYLAPKMVLYHGAVQTGCGRGTAQTGPFYCSADRTIYIDLDFFRNMESEIGAKGDFAYAYVIAHEVGHHVQNLLGTLDKAHAVMARQSQRDANKTSVRLELQADFYAGIWAYNDNKMFGSIEPGDVENAINAASKIGDDYLQRQSMGYEIPDSFNHGRSSQRVRWLSRGLDTGDPLKGDTFSPDYGDL